jgi:hypothetical protein
MNRFWMLTLCVALLAFVGCKHEIGIPFSQIVASLPAGSTSIYCEKYNDTIFMQMVTWSGFVMKITTAEELNHAAKYHEDSVHFDGKVVVVSMRKPGGDPNTAGQVFFEVDRKVDIPSINDPITFSGAIERAWHVPSYMDWIFHSGGQRVAVELYQAKIVNHKYVEEFAK